MKITDAKLVEEEFIKVFQTLMGGCAPDLQCANTEVIKKGPCLTLEQQKLLIQPVTNKEIIEAIKDMPKDKAPGVDGFSVEFFTRNSEIVKEDIFEVVQNFFKTNRLPQMINTTTIALVPKVNVPATVKDY